MRLGLSLLMLVGAVPVLAAEARGIAVPYRLTDTKHVLVRARINGVGPWHFILDTGAPAWSVSQAVAARLGVEAGADGWATFDRLEIEGGVVIDQAKGRIADPSQIQTMNRLGLAGVELHGIIGYNILARYRIELDVTRPKMTWTPLPFDPPLPRIAPRPDGAGTDNLARLATVLMDKQADFRVHPRGFLGIELAKQEPGLVIAAVLPNSPAAKAGLRAGDVLVLFAEEAVRHRADVARLAAERNEGAVVSLTVRRGNAKMAFTITLGKGL
ncbi:MAG: PDZ domain-containing protein [Gemmataceae bacterium]